MPGEGKNDADLERIPKTYTQKRIRQTKPPPTPVLPGGPADPDRHIVQVDPDKIQVIQTRSTRGYPRGALVLRITEPATQSLPSKYAKCCTFNSVKVSGKFCPTSAPKGGQPSKGSIGINRDQ